MIFGRIPGDDRMPSGTSFVTTDPAPTIARAPICTPPRIVAPVPMLAPRLTTVGMTFQSLSVCRPPPAGRGAWIVVVDEIDAVTDEDLVFNGHAFADEGVAGNLAVASDRDAFLNLDERADPGAVPDLTTVEIDEVVNVYVATELDVRRDLANSPSHQLDLGPGR